MCVCLCVCVSVCVYTNKKIGDQAHCGFMSQSPQVFCSVCATCTFVWGMSKSCKLAEIILIILGQECKFYRQSGRTTAPGTWFRCESGHPSLYNITI